MRLTILALEYDGTIARDDRLEASLLDAIAVTRRHGITVMLVTGRRLQVTIALPRVRDERV